MAALLMVLVMLPLFAFALYGRRMPGAFIGNYSGALSLSPSTLSDRELHRLISLKSITERLRIRATTGAKKEKQKAIP